MKRTIMCTLYLLCCLGLSRQTALNSQSLATSVPQKPPDGLFSRLAFTVPAIAEMAEGLAAPDGAAALHAEKDDEIDCCWPYKVWLTRKSRRYELDFGTYVEAEVEWAPDSAAFFVTYSDGGAVGQFHALVYRVDDHGVHRSEPIPDGRRLSKPVCYGPESPNVAAIQWGPDSRTLLIAVEVQPHSYCASMGTFRAFEISLPRAAVLKEYGQLTAKGLFGRSLGQELANADDDCVSNPQECVPPGLELPKSSKTTSK